jgi:hypothetical protein
VTYDDFERYGIHRHAIGPAIREVVALGFVEITEAGRAGNAEWRKPNLFRLTYRHTKYESTNEWEKIKTLEEAVAIAQAARAPHQPRKNKTQWRKAPVFGDGKRHHTDEFQGTENTTTSDSAEFTTTLDISGRGPCSAEQPSGAAPNGAASARSEGRRRQSEKNRERSEQVSGAAYSDRAVSPGKLVGSHAGRAVEAMTEAKHERSSAVGVSKRTGKNSEPSSAGNGTTASVSERACGRNARQRSRREDRSRRASKQ